MIVCYIMYSTSYVCLFIVGFVAELIAAANQIAPRARYRLSNTKFWKKTRSLKEEDVRKIDFY